MNFEDENKEMSFFHGWVKRYWFLWIGTLVAISIAGFIFTRSVQVVDTGLVRYQEFQEIYNTCESLKTKICNLKDIPDSDTMFQNNPSKAAQINGLRNNLARWVNEYNAKSKLINFNVWKSNNLPYELNVERFDCK